MAAATPSLSSRSLSGQRILGRIVLYLSAAWFAFFAAFPFIWMGITAFKQNADLYNIKNNPFLFNAPPTLVHMRLLFDETLFSRWIFNTGLVATVVVIITLIAAVPAGYSLARLTGRWGRRLGIAIFLTYLVPPSLLFIPLARVIVAVLGLQDTICGARARLPVVYHPVLPPGC